MLLNMAKESGHIPDIPEIVFSILRHLEVK